LALIAAVVWLAVGLLRWHKGLSGVEEKLISLVGIVGLTLYGFGVFDGLPSLDTLLEQLATTLGEWTYLLVAVLAFLETGAFVGLVAPGEATVVIGGVVAGQGVIDIRLLIGLVWFAAFMGDTVSFFLGRRLGREFMLKHGARVKITEARLDQVERYMHDHGGKTILIGRFIGLVRALAPFIAGSSKMPYRRFMPYDIIGSGLWAAFFCLLGYVFSNNIEGVLHWAQRGIIIFGWTVAALVALVFLIRHFRKPEARAKFGAWIREQEQHRWRGRLVRPLVWCWEKIVLPTRRLFGPQLRFAWERLTPGNLGLEFTTVMAVLASAGYTFYFYSIAAANWPTRFTDRINDAAFKVADSLRTDWLDSLAEAITHLGAFHVAAAFTLIAAGYCLHRRRVAEAVVLVLSLAIAGLLTSPLKEFFAVPRPSDPVVATRGYAYPSGHSAYAVTYVTIAITLQRVRDIITRAALVVAAIALTATIALTRVYLRAHYLSDVIGGVSLTATITATIAAIAFLVIHIRALRRSNAAEPSDIVG
jgi:undecaprenyl-diphosphatase